MTAATDTILSRNSHPPTTLNLPIIAIHRSPLQQKFGAPRQPNLVHTPSQIIMQPPFDTPDAFVGMDAYSHLWILWQFHHNKPQPHFRPQVRPPRLGGNDKLGVFATRSMYRPAAVGLSVVKLDKVAVVRGSAVLHILGADMIDGTPIIDIKPYLPYADSLPDAYAAHMDKPASKKVHLTPNAQSKCQAYHQLGCLQDGDMDIISALIAQDPRPAYRQTEIGTPFSMRYGVLDVVFYMDDTGVLLICDLLIV